MFWWPTQVRGTIIITLGILFYKTFIRCFLASWPPSEVEMIIVTDIFRGRWFLIKVPEEGNSHNVVIWVISLIVCRGRQVNSGRLSVARFILVRDAGSIKEIAVNVHWTSQWNIEVWVMIMKSCDVYFFYTFRDHKTPPQKKLRVESLVKLTGMVQFQPHYPFAAH